MIEVKITDAGTQAALARMQAGLGNLEGVMRTIGEDVMEMSKASFEQSASPDGQRWPMNAQATILHYLEQTGGSANRQGKLSAKGSARVMSKKPLIGISRDLARQFSYVAERDSVTISNGMVYAAMQQFGGSKTEFPNLWGDIPARPFMPIDASGQLSAAGHQVVNDAITDYLDTLADG